MLRCRPPIVRARALISITRCLSHRRWSTREGSSSSSGSTPNNATVDDDDHQHLRAARLWLAGLHAEMIPLRSIGELSYSRSSGPGGQNVNKYDQLAKVKRRAILSMAQKSQFKGYFEGSPGRTAKICPLRYS
jgi:peptidyl-tRNA hydrolase ICT1